MSEDGDGVEGVKEIAQSEAGFFFWGKGFDFRTGNEAGEPINGRDNRRDDGNNNGRERAAWLGNFVKGIAGGENAVCA